MVEKNISVPVWSGIVLFLGTLLLQTQKLYRSPSSQTATKCDNRNLLDFLGALLGFLLQLIPRSTLQTLNF